MSVEYSKTVTCWKLNLLLSVTSTQRRHSLLTRVDKVQGPPRSKGPPSATCKNLCHELSSTEISRDVFSWHWFRFCSWGTLFQAWISRRNWDIKKNLGFTETHYQFQNHVISPRTGYTAWVLFATIHVTVTSAERSFSKLKLRSSI